ncbi:MAG: hypothetical protein Q9227_009580 [Pyrenula ochraceoflavens]
MDRRTSDIGQGSRSATGIPRPSRLPAPRATINAATTATTIRTSNQGSIRASKSIILSPTRQISPEKNFASNARTVRRRETANSEAYALAKDNPLQQAASHSEASQNEREPDSVLEANKSPAKRRPRPSLSDRTVETLSQIALSPSPNKRRSGFFPTDSPARHGLRPNSAMSNFRNTIGPSSPSKQTNAPPIPAVPTTFSQRTTPSVKTKTATTRPPFKASTSPRKLDIRTPSTSPSKRRPPLPNFQPPSQEEMEKTTSRIGRLNLNSGRTAGRSREASGQSASTTGSTHPSRSNISSRTSPRSPASPPTDIEQSDIKSPKGAKSSSAFRESIVRAKAQAAKNRRVSDRATNTHPNTFTDTLGFEDASDPFNQEPKEGRNSGLLRKRVEAGKISGNLSIVGMELLDIPDEVMKMYDFDPNAIGSSWAESVDLVKLLASDNKIEYLREDAFPDVGVHEAAEDDNLQFRGLELLDFRGNMLKSLPRGLSRLDRLHTLTLSGNQLNMSSISLISQLENLKDLNLSNNCFSGGLAEEIGMLSHLQILNLSGNELTDIGRFPSFPELKFLNVSSNKLTSLPFGTLTMLPLIELLASKNRLSGALIPSNASALTSLQTLDVSSNSLSSLTESESTSLPSLRTVSLSGNRLTTLPNISTWTHLQSLNASENALSAIPDGFTSLKEIKTANFASNNITRLDEKLVLMESLRDLNVQGNPLRERRFFTMGWEGIKKDLERRLERGQVGEPAAPVTKAEGEALGQTDEAPQVVRKAQGMRGGGVNAAKKKQASQPPSWLYGDDPES